MKNIGAFLFVLWVCGCLMPSRLPAQSRYTATETFDGHPSYTLTPTSLWDTCAALHTSAPYAFRSPLPQQQGDSSLLVSPVYDFSACGEVWLLFDHICKIARTDIACIEIREDVLGAVWHRIPSDCYKSVSAGYRQQQFSDASYAEWLTDSVSAVPTNAWWKTECFDLSTEAAYTKIQLRFKVKKGTEEAGRFAFGWLLDNIRLLAGEKQVLPPYLNLTAPVYAGEAASVGPFVVGFRVEGSPPVRVSARYSMAGKPFMAEVRQTGAATFQFEIPATPYGNRFAYTVAAEDAAGNCDSLTRQFSNPFPQDGRDSDAVRVVRLLSPSLPVVQAGASLPVRVQVRNSGIRTLTSLRIGWSYAGTGGSFPWQGSLPADFCSDTLQVALLPAVTVSDTLKIWAERPNGRPAVSDTLFYPLACCAEMLHGTYLVGPGGDFSDLPGALAVLQRCGLSATTLLLLERGSHALWLPLGGFRRLHNTDSLVIASRSGEASAVTLTADSLHESIVRLERCHHLYFRNLTFRLDSGQRQADCALRLLDSCHHIGVEGCRFLLGHPDAAGIAASGRTGCHHLTLAENRFEGGHIGLYVAGNRLRDYRHLRITDNLFDGQSAYGISLMAADFSLIGRNRFHSPAVPQNANRQYTGISLYGCNGERMEGNRFRLRTGKCAISLTAVQPDTAALMEICNNEIRFEAVQNQSAGIRAGGSCRLLRLAHNSILITGTGYGNSCAAFFGRCDSLFWHHNLLLHLGRGSGSCVWDFSALLPGDRVGHFWEGNHYHVPFGGYVQTDHLLTRLEEWQQWQHQDLTATEGEVRFRDTAAGLEPCTADPVCLRSAEVAYDLNGRARSVPLTTKGAWHNIGVQALDAFPLPVSLPESAGTGGDSLPLRVVVGNGGALPLKVVHVGVLWNGLFRAYRLPLLPLSMGDTATSGVLAHLHPQSGFNTLKIWTFLPNDTTDEQPGNDTVSFRLYGCDSALAGDYLVGGPQAAFQDLEHAWQRVRHCGVAAPVRLLLPSGRYVVRLALQDKVPGSDSLHTVTITSAARQADSVLLCRDSAAEGQRAALFLAGASHIILEHLTLVGSHAAQPSYSMAVELSDSCSDIRIRHCRLLAQAAAPASVMCAGLYAADGTGSRLQLHHNLLEGGMYGIYLQGASPNAGWHGVDIRDNRFAAHSEQSVFLKHLQFEALSGNSAASFQLQSVTGNEIRANRLHAEEKGGCLQLYEVGPSPAVGRLLLSNNECISRSSLPHTGIEIGRYCHDISCCHNSLSLVGSGRGRCLSLQEDATVWNIFVRQNLFCQGSGSDTASIAWSALRSPSAYRFDNNRYGRMPFLDASSCLQLEKGSPFACLRLPEAAQDIFSQPRPVLTAIGAYPPLLHDTDACLFRWVSPTEPARSGQPVSLRVLLGNAGDSALHHVEIGWAADGVFQSSTHWQGLLARGDTVTVDLGSFYPLQSTRLTAFVRQAEGAADSNAANDTLACRLQLCDSALGGTYRIGRDFATLEEALEALYQCGIRKSVRLLLPAGRHVGSWQLDRRVAGSSAAHTVCLAADSLGGVVLALPDDPQSGQAVLQCSHTAHWRFERLCFEIPSRQTEAVGIRLLFDCEDMAVDSCRFRMQEHSLAALAQTTDWGVCGLRFTGNEVTGGQDGLRLTASSARPDSLLYLCDNRFTDIRICGIYLRQAHFSAISRNLIRQLAGSGNGFYGVDAEQVRGEVMDANRIVASRGYYGLYFSQVSGAGGPLLVTNNEIHLQVLSSNCGIYLYNGCNRLKILHNSVLLEGKGMGKCLYTAFRLSDIILKNNSFVNLCGNSGSTQTELLYLYPGNGFSGWQADHNHYYSVGRYPFYCGSAFSTLAEWQSYTGKEPHSRFFRPQYTDKSVSLLMTEADSLKAPLLPEVPSDRQGLERGNPTTMGAHQAVRAAVCDWALCAFDSLDAGTDCPAVFQPLRVRLRNEGGDTICLEKHPVVLCLQVEGPLQLQRRVRITEGCLPPRHSGSFLLQPRFSLGSSGTYRLTAWTEDAADIHPENDTLRMLFKVQRQPLPLATNMTQADTLFRFSVRQGSLSWRVETGGEGPSARYGAQRLCFPSAGARGGIAWAALPVMDLSGLRRPLLSLWYARDGGSKAEPDQIRVLVSTDGGVQYRQAAVLYRYKQGAAAPVWERADVDLSTYAGPCVRIVLEGVSYGGGNQYVDSLSLAGTPWLQWACAPVPVSVEDCRIAQRRLSLLLSNPGAQAVEVAQCSLHCAVQAPFTFSYRLQPALRLPPYGSDTIVIDTAFAWEVGQVYRIEALLQADTLLLADTLHQTVSTVADVGLQQLQLPDCAGYSEVIFPSVTVRNTGSLALHGIPLEILLDDSLVHTDTLTRLAAGESLRYRCTAGVRLPASNDTVYTLEIRSLLDCDGDYADNSCFARGCLRQRPDSTRVAERRQELLCRISPNPARGAAFLEVELPVAMAMQVEVTNLQGQRLYVKCPEGQAGTNRIRLPAAGMAAGIYVCRVRCGNRQWTGKWVVL